MKSVLTALACIGRSNVRLTQRIGMKRLWVVIGCFMGVAVLLVNAPVATAQTVTTLASFSGNPDGVSPNPCLAHGRDGNLYGTTQNGGAGTVYGTVFKATTAGVLTPLYSFKNGNDGSYPYAGLVQGSDGTLYGTTNSGGSAGDGTVFKITPGSSPKTLFTLQSARYNGTYHDSGVILGSDGLLYGTTAATGYGNGYGAIFTVDPNSAGAHLLYLFNGAADGAYPFAGLVQGQDGNFYGTTTLGGAGYGTVFKITPAGVLSTLYTFGGGADGAKAETPLVQGSDGNFYGTTNRGGASGYGTIFRITPTGTLTTLYSFPNNNFFGNDGTYFGLVQANDGNLYGTAPQGGNGYGVIFKLTHSGVLTAVYSFNRTDGNGPVCLIQGTDGNLYGVTQGGGAMDYGTVFKVVIQTAATPTFSPAGGTYTGSKAVTINTSTTGAAIYYTLDGSTPTVSSTQYTGPITVSSTETIKAIAAASNYNPSAVASATYTITPIAATPTFSLAGGTYTGTQTVTISDTTSGASIRYTTDGSTPTPSSTLYSGPLSIAKTTTLKAIAVATGYANSAVASATYTIQSPAATPTFNPGSGTYTGTQSVTISDSTTGATIYYTVDGSTPTAASTKYSGPIGVSKSETIKAIAVASGYANSAVASATYTIQTPAATPAFSLAAGTYTGTQTVTISDATSGATIRYTTDGSTPTASSTLYSGSISVSKTTTLKAIAMASGYADSAVASATYTIQTRAATPTFNPAGGTYNSTQSVTISDSTSGATIRYTTDGSTPTAASTPYSGPISVTKTTTLKAIAMASGYADSAVATASYTIQTPAATPTFNPGSGTYTSSQSVTISDGTAGASIYYTTDGSTPTTSSSKYSGPIAVSSSKTLKAIATGSGYSTSAVASATYTIQSQAATPAFSPAGGTYTGAQSITITDGTAGAIIRYTTDGSTPTASSPQYTGPISVSSSMTIKAIAIASGYANSSVASASYTILVPAATPTFSPAGGTYTGSQTVTLSDATSGATIRYTTDGSTPTASSTPYSGPITIASTSTVKAIAMASGYANSAVASATYTIQMPAATPTFSLASGTYKGTQSVTISDSTGGATIRYTTDGTTPTASSTQYTGPLSVSSSMTIKAIATASGYATSAVASATYNIEAASGSDDSSGGGGATSPALLGLFAVGAMLRRSGLGSRRRSKRRQRAA